jgi:hypothetical protein
VWCTAVTCVCRELGRALQHLRDASRSMRCFSFKNGPIGTAAFRPQWLATGSSVSLRCRCSNVRHRPDVYNPDFLRDIQGASADAASASCGNHSKQVLHCHHTSPAITCGAACFKGRGVYYYTVVLSWPQLGGMVARPLKGPFAFTISCLSGLSAP